jgi:predicted aspartyl protease
MTVALFAGRAWSQPGKVTCSIDQRKPSEADTALTERRYPDAERLYGEALRANPSSFEAMAGLVRATLAEGKLSDALDMAIKDDAAHPGNPILLDALGEVRYRRGEVNEAATVLNTSIHIDPCNGITNYDMSRFLSFSGMAASAQKRLDLAHTLAPENQRIKELWSSTHQIPMTPQERLTALKNRLSEAGLTADEKEGIQAAIHGIETQEKGDCELVSPVTEAKVPMVPIWYKASYKPEDMYAAGLDVLINGKRERLEIDSGASGLLLSRAVASRAGLVPELETSAGGIGDEGRSKAFVAHVDDIKIGGMEFKNCRVGVLEHSDVLGTEGLIGPDVFRNYVVTLDIPGRELRVGPLPNRPGETPSGKSTALNTSESTDATSTLAERARDRYIAPEMKDWTPVFRSDHFLIFPTSIGKAPVKLFIMDTGAGVGMISPEAAREVTKVAGDNSITIKGLSGEVRETQTADWVTITFANISQLTEGMISYDASILHLSQGVEISGLIGFPTLRELVISIDYRDNLVHVVYDPTKGYHVRRPY